MSDVSSSKVAPEVSGDSGITNVKYSAQTASTDNNERRDKNGRSESAQSDRTFSDGGGKPEGWESVHRKRRCQ